MDGKHRIIKNTYDSKTDEPTDGNPAELEKLLNDIMESSEEDCESCKI